MGCDDPEIDISHEGENFNFDIKMHGWITVILNGLPFDYDFMKYVPLLNNI